MDATVRGPYVTPAPPPEEPAAGTRIHYVWDSATGGSVGNGLRAVPGTTGGIVLAFNGDNQLIARYVNGPNTSAYDQFFSTLAEEDVTSATSPGPVTFAQLDQQGSVVDIADDSGNLADHIEYSSTGQVVSESNAATLHLAGWQGGIPDATTGMENFDHRWYIAASAVWASQDPLGFGGGDTNLTRSRANDQINLVDPTGLAAEDEYVPPDINWADARYSAGNEQHDWTNWFTGIPDGLSEALSDAVFNARQGFDQLVDHPIDTTINAGSTALNGAKGLLSGKTISDAVIDYHTSPTNRQAGQKFGKTVGQAGVSYAGGAAVGRLLGPAAKALTCPRPPSRSRAPLAVPKKVYTTTDVPVDLARPKGTFVTEIDISAPEALVPHVQRNVPPSAARPSGTLPRYVTEIEVPEGSVLPDPTVPYRPNTGTGWVPPSSQGARVGTMWEVTEDAWGRPILRRTD